MKKDNSLKQAARWVARMFGYKAENKFARVLWYVFATCAAIAALLLAASLIENLVFGLSDLRQRRERDRMENSATYLHDYGNQYASPFVIYHDGYPGYLYNTILGHRTTTGIQWICKSSDGDSLAVFCSSTKGKRGYFNRFTGEVAVPAQYEKAWIFSEGMACVLDKGMLHFIDHKGQPLMGKEFPYTMLIDDYCFHNGLCSMLGENNRIGLIDKQGNWVVAPEYYGMSYDNMGFWYVRDGDWNDGLLDAKGELLLPTEYKNIVIVHEDSCILTRHPNHIHQVLDFKCNVINPCDYIEVNKIVYVPDGDGDNTEIVANCRKYRTTENYYGLMDKDGNILTPSVFSDITAIGPDRYHCRGPHGSVILNGKGEACGK